MKSLKLKKLAAYRTPCRVSLSVKPKKLVAVVGHVGAGKSSLISAFLGEMEKDGGSVTLKVEYECLNKR